MITRREFLKDMALGGMVLSLDPISLFASPERPFEIMADNASLPVWKDVDVLIAGSSTGAVAAAVAAARAGAKVLVVSPYTYPGEDVCASFRFWGNDSDSASELYRSVFPGAIAPQPLQVKSALETAMIGNGVDFLYSSFVSSILVDGAGAVSGVCISNRSGVQAIRAKVVIDATLEATVARMAGVPFHPFRPGKHRFVHTVVGASLKSDPRIVSAEEIFPAFNTNDKSCRAIRYTVDLPLADGSYDSLMEAEQILRDITWDVDLTDSSDTPWIIPSSYMDSDKPLSSSKVANIFVLGPCSAVPRDKAEEFLLPANFMETGGKLGAEAARSASSRPVPSGLAVPAAARRKDACGEVRFINSYRPVEPVATAQYTTDGLKVLGEYDVLVVGGGTAGAPATISAARNGSKVLVLEYLHGFGGMGTYGYIGRYTAGYRKGFTAEMDEAMKTIAPKDHPRHVRPDAAEWATDWKAEWYRKEIRKAGAQVWYQAIVSGAVVKDGRVTGVMASTPYGTGLVLAKCIIDSTGSADVAIAAGAQYEYTGKASLAVQGAGLPKFTPGDHYNNTDWTFIDDSDVVDVTRLFIQGRAKNQGEYDTGKIPQTRERRRIVARYNVSVFDMVNKRTYADTISYHISNFDTHGYTEDSYFTINPPTGHGDNYDVKLPLRSLLPLGLTGIMVTGLGSGAHRDAMPIVRMQPDVQNQGYAAGLVASEAAKAGVLPEEVDIKAIQRRLVSKGTLPEEILSEGDSAPVTKADIQAAVASLTDNYAGLEKILAEPQLAMPMLLKACAKAPAADKLYYANVLCMLGNAKYSGLVLDAVRSYGEWDKGWNYRGMHQFGFSVSRLDNYVIALAKCRCKEAAPEIIRLAGLLTPKSEFSHFRAVSEYFQANPTDRACDVLSGLLSIPGMCGYHIANAREATRKIALNVVDRVYVLEDSLRNKALKEIFLARALYDCSDKDGLGKKILENYASGMEGHYARYAWETLGN